MLSSILKSRATQRLVCALLVAGTILIGTGAGSTSTQATAPQRGGEFMIVNRSSYTIAALFLSPSARRRWGRDQLGRNNVIRPGGSFTLHSIPCGLYDVRLVDEDGDECIVTEISMCRDHTHWDLTNNDLLECEGFR